MADILDNVVIPAPLTPGDTVAITSPAGAVAAELWPAAIDVLQAQGWQVRVMPHARGRRGTYSGTVDERISDMCAAVADPAVRAIICGRGGYGSMAVADYMLRACVHIEPKWLVGFSDITALHGLWLSHGIASVHGPMVRALHYARCGGETTDVAALVDMLSGRQTAYTFASHPLNRQGSAAGTLTGGNLAMLSVLAGTPLDLVRRGAILFIEDVNEPIYKVERMLWQLRLRGVLSRLAGLVVGQLTGAEPDSNYGSVQQMIAAMVADYRYPVSYDAPIGHGRRNIPLLQGGRYALDVGPAATTLAQLR